MLTVITFIALFLAIVFMVKTALYFIFYLNSGTYSDKESDYIRLIFIVKDIYFEMDNIETKENLMLITNNLSSLNIETCDGYSFNIDLIYPNFERIKKEIKNGAFIEVKVLKKQYNFVKNNKLKMFDKLISSLFNSRISYLKLFGLKAYKTVYFDLKDILPEYFVDNYTCNLAN